MAPELSNKNDQLGDRYLLVLSILLGISVLKLTEVMTLGGTLKAILAEAEMKGLTASAVGIFVVVGAYLVFFTLVLLAVLGVARQFGDQAGQKMNAGELVAMSVGALGVAYATAFAFTIYGLSTP
ncbi:MAG: hypothetical protein ACT4PU_00645 [Planctomycetota bacterium]